MYASRFIAILVVPGLLGACTADSTDADTDGSSGSSSGGSSTSGDEPENPATTEPLTTGGASGGLPFDCIACSLLLQFLGGGGMPMDGGGMMPPADGGSGGMPEIEFCEGAVELIDGLVACGCQSGCGDACANYCSEGFDPTVPDMAIIECLSCVAADEGCGTAVQACENDEVPSGSTGAGESGGASTSGAESSSGTESTSGSGTSTDSSESSSTG